jgi:hypothetical protein
VSGVLEPSARPDDAQPGRRGGDARARDSQPPPRTDAQLALPSGPREPRILRRASSDEPPESTGVMSDYAPLTRAGPPPAFSTRHPWSGDSTAPATTIGLREPVAVEPPPDSHGVTQGDPIAMLASAVRGRVTGALVLSSLDGKRVRRILLRDGDMVNAASDDHDDALVRFLVARGDLSPEVGEARRARLPHTGRHAAAALIANGFLGQDDLWPVLRAHAEWIIGRALLDAPALGHIEREPPERLRAEPNVFGGAAGVEVFIESVRRVLGADAAIMRLGGLGARVDEGRAIALLAESALSSEEMDLVQAAIGQTLERVIEHNGSDIAAVLCALCALQILASREPSDRPARRSEPDIDPLDADAVRKRVAARIALVHEADYFALLGVNGNATSYEIRRAYVELRRVFEPTRLLTASTADLHDDVLLIVEVLDEAYQVLRDPHRRARYRRALEATGPRADAH